MAKYVYKHVEVLDWVDVTDEYLSEYLKPGERIYRVRFRFQGLEFERHVIWSPKGAESPWVFVQAFYKALEAAGGSPANHHKNVVIG